MRWTQADATGMLPSLASTSTPAGGMVGGGSATAQTPQYARHSHGDIQVSVFIVLCGIESNKVYCRTSSQNNDGLLCEGLYNRLHRPAGGSANERSPHFCLARVAAYTSVRMLRTVAWAQDPSRPLPLVPPMPSTDPGSRLVATVILRERRRIEIHSVRSIKIPVDTDARCMRGAGGPPGDPRRF